MALSDTQLAIAVTFAEALFYGLYCAVFLVFLGIWMRKKINPVLAGVTVLMFVTATVHMVLFLWGTLSPVPLPRNLQARVFLAYTHITMGEGILVWRVWAVWGGSYRIIVIPVTLMTVAFAFGMRTAATTLKTSAVFNLVSPSMWLANNIICNGLIAGKILYVNSLVRSVGQASTLTGRYLGVLLLLLESGAIYTAAQITTLVLQSLNNRGLEIVLDLDLPLFGLLPTIIIVLVQLQIVPGNRPTTLQPSINLPLTIVWRRSEGSDSKVQDSIAEGNNATFSGMDLI